MKRLILSTSLVVTLAAFSACEPERTTRKQPTNGGFHQNPTTTEKPKHDSGDEDPNRPDHSEKPDKPDKPKQPDEAITKPVVEQPKVVGEVPYGKAVPGKPGFVTSPFSSQGYIDARGFPPGTEVKDPYSGKTFLVP
ncbi:MAG: hypothetical protein K8R23_09520 [Chthoniobacter sp.]|nr:hypothetical protein [Chthoniobacter sp.]